MITLSVAKNFSRNLGGKADAKTFRETILYPAFEQDSVTVDLNGTYGFSSLWLKEVFGETALKYKNLITIEQFLERITIISDDISLFGEIRDYIEDAYDEKPALKKPFSYSTKIDLEGLGVTLGIKEDSRGLYELMLGKDFVVSGRYHLDTVYFGRKELKEFLQPFVNYMKEGFENDTY